jgi:hypothetical protein
MEGVTMKQTQHHGKRAQRGKPDHTARISFRCTPKLLRAFRKNGGSDAARRILEGVWS